MELFYQSCVNDIKSVIRKLEHDTLLAIEWFGVNFMKLNEDKCNFLFAGHKHKVVFARAGSSTIWESTQEKLLGVYHVYQRKLHIKSFIESQFGYSRLA